MGTNRAQSELYPLGEPFTTQHLDVGEGYEIFIQQYGNPDGIPVLYLHGGPGGCCSAKHTQIFNPEKYHIILHDQRGGGQSKPAGKASLQANTTQHLIADIEKIRLHFNLDKVLLCGISWGSTLALAYAQAHPAKVLGLALGAVFLGEKWNIRWVCEPSGAARFFPAEYRQLLDTLDLNWGSSYEEILATVNAALSHADSKRQKQTVMAWLTWVDRIASPAWQEPAHAEDNSEPDWGLLTSLVQIELHYDMNHCFMNPNQLLHQANQLRNIPGVIVHGRYDLLCPVKQAYQLAMAWPDGDLHIIQQAAHSSSELRPTLLKALDQFTPQTGFGVLQEGAA